MYCIRVTIVTINGNAYWRFFNGEWSENNGIPVAGFSKSDNEIKYYPSIESAQDDAERMEMVDGIFKVEIVPSSKGGLI